MKEPVMAAPQAPGVGGPSVTSVEYFKDWQRTKPIAEAHVGDTVYIQIIFSEKMQVVVADDKTARPILYYKADKNRARFRVAPLGAKGKNFTDGDIKPLKTATTFLGKYIVQEGVGKLTVAVGKQSTDLQGTPLGVFYTHKEALQIRQPDTTPPEVVSVSYYADEALTEPLTDTVHPGDTIYTKIVFSEQVRVTVADNNAGHPVLYHRWGRDLIRFRIVPRGTGGEHAASGTAMPIGDGSAYLGTYTVADSDLDQQFTVAVGKHSTDLQGNRLEQFYAHPEQLRIAERSPEPTVPLTGPVAVVYGAPKEPFSNKILDMVVGGEGITHYRYALSRDDQCSKALFDIYSPSPRSVLKPIGLNNSRSAGRWTQTLCVVGRDADGVWQEVPTIYRLTYDPAAIDILPQEVYTFTAEDRIAYPRAFEGYINLQLMVGRTRRGLTTQDYAEEFGVAFRDVDISLTQVRALRVAKALISDYSERFEHTSWVDVEILRLWVESPKSSNDEILARFEERVEQGVLFALKSVINWSTLTISF